MIAYINLVFLAFMLSFIALKDGRVIFGNSEVIKLQNFAIPAVFLYLYILVACRAVSVGSDTENYMSLFSIYKGMQFSELIELNDNIETTYKILNWVVGRFTDNFQVFLAIATAITILPIYYVYREDKRDSYLKLVLFINMTTFVLLFSGIRQALAIAICMLAYQLIKQKKFVTFVICVFFAASIHLSAFIFLPAYWVYYLRIKRRHLWIILFIVFLSLIFNRLIFSYAIVFINHYNIKYGVSTNNTGAYMSFVLFLLFTLFSYFIPDENNIDSETIGLRNFLVLALLVQSFAPIHSLAMRFGYYYIIFIPVLLPKVIHSSGHENIKFAYISKLIIIIFFTFYFVFTTYRSYETGTSLLNTIPYIPFWKY